MRLKKLNFQLRTGHNSIVTRPHAGHLRYHRFIAGRGKIFFHLLKHSDALQGPPSLCDG